MAKNLQYLERTMRPNPARTPVLDLPNRTAIVVTFKHEIEENGQPVGPISFHAKGESTLRPYDPNREPNEWVTLSEAYRRAKAIGAELEIS